jgi:pimeloyl-ACP methyl ester carboxylesterase
MRNATWAFLLALSCAHVTRVTSIQGPQGRLHVDDGGRGPAVPVLFVHGNGANLTQWRDQLDHLRLTRRAVAFDLRGMGQSDVPANGDYSVAAMVDDVEAVADALHLKRFVIVGHSYGGTVVAAYAAKHPERVAGVVFADAAGTVRFTDEAAAKFLAALRKDKDTFARQWFAPILKSSTPRVQEAVFASVHATPVDAFAGALEGMRHIDVAQMVAAYHGPRIAIAAADIESPASLHVEFPQIAVKKIAGTGHWLMMDKPEEFNRALDEFLTTVDAERK